MKLILVRSRKDDCCPECSVSTQAKLVFPSHLSRTAKTRNKRDASTVSALLWLGHSQKDGRGLCVAD